MRPRRPPARPAGRPRTSSSRGLLAAQAHLFALGITSWQDAAVGEMFGQRDLLAGLPRRSAVRRAGRAGSWVRCGGTATGAASRSPSCSTGAVRRRLGRFRPTTVKIMQDGVAENFTAAMLEPYLDGCGCHDRERRPQLRRPRGAARARHAARRRGFQVHFHALGDRAVREALDAVAGGPVGERPDATVGTTSRTCRSCTPTTCRASRRSTPRPTSRRCGPRTSRRWTSSPSPSSAIAAPAGSTRSAALERAGAHLVAGSDWSVSSADPLDGIHVAVNRRVAGAPEGTEPLTPSTRSRLASAMTAYTAGSAQREPPGRHDRAPRRGHRTPTSSCSTATRSPTRRTRSRRPRSSRPSSRASACSSPADRPHPTPDRPAVPQEERCVH